MLQIIPDLQGGVSAQATIETAAALTRAGANALVATRGGRLVAELQAKGGVIVPFPAHVKNPLGMMLNIIRLARLIKAEKVDIVHARSRAAAWVAYGATRLTKTPFVTSFPGRYANATALVARYNSVLAWGDVVIADSAYAADAIAKNHPSAEGKIHIAKRSVDCRVFAPKAVEPVRVRALRREWKIEPDESVVLLAASLGPASGHKLFIEAARLLRAEGLTSAKFIIAGDEQRRGMGAEIDKAIAKAGLQDMVRRVGRCADLPAALLAASVVVAPSTRAEAFAGPVLEAQAMGTPVIVTDLGAAAELVNAPPEVDTSSRTGWRTPSGDPAALAASIQAALALGATARDQLGLRARTRVEMRFSIDQFCADTLDAYAADRSSEARP